MESQEVTKYYEEPKPLTALEIRANVNLIQEVMKSVMQVGQHYGKIPGAGDKPTLLKAGAEKIMATFRLAPDPEIMDLSKNGCIRYQIKCRLISPSGRYLGAGVGEASTDEEKYKWRVIVSKEEWEATPETERRIKFKRDGQVKQVRTNPADLANTVLKMAKKRSLVDAVLTVTAASDIFTQDIEDIPEEILQKKEESKKETPPANKTIITPIVNVTKTKDKEEYKIFGNLNGNEQSFKTGDVHFAETARKEKGTGFQFRIEFDEKLNIISLLQHEEKLL